MQWTKSIREKERIVFGFFYELKEDRMTDGALFQTKPHGGTTPSHVIGVRIKKCR